MSQVYYHGTSKDFEKPKLNALGILWLAPNPKVAQEYATPHWVKGPGYVWEIHLKGGSKVVNLRDLSHPVVREAFDMMNEQARMGMGAWSEEAWGTQADFGMLEYRRWMIGFFKKKRIDGLVVQDTLSTTPLKHESLALLRLAAIESMERKVVERGQVRTLGEIEKDIQEWGQAGRVARRYLRHV